MMKRIQERMMNDKKRQMECLFNKAIMPKCNQIAIGKEDVTIPINEYERLKRVEQDHHKGLEQIILSDEMMEYDLKLMQRILDS